jgi:two-component system sensor histidine kinase BaeS
MAYAFLEQLRGSLWLIVGVAVLLSAGRDPAGAPFPAPDRAPGGRRRRLADGRFDVRLAATRSDELGELARHFNALAERLAGAEEARRQWVADTSHELRTPLAVLRAQLEALQDGVRSATPATSTPCCARCWP